MLLELAFPSLGNRARRTVLRRHDLHEDDAPVSDALPHLPAAILADLLGLHINTAVRWATYARKEWTDYLAERAAEQEETDNDRNAT